MIRALSLSVAITFVVGLSPLGADEPAAPTPVDNNASPIPESKMPVQDVSGLWPSAGSVKDLLAFDISTLNSKTEGAWMVARIRPGGLSGAAHFQGGYIQAETGKTVENGVTPKVVILVGGQWELMELISGQAPREGRYQWKELPPNHWDRNFSMIDTFSVFQGAKSKGTVICQFFEKQTGAKQFANVTLIPDKWKSLVKPAHEYYRQHQDDLAGDDIDKLRKLALNDNALVGVTAIRQLLVQNTEDEQTDKIVELASSLPKLRQAVLIAGLLKKDDELSRLVVLKTIDRASSLTELTGTALGIYTWSASQGRVRSNPASARKLHDALIKKWRSFDSSTSDNWTESLNKLLLATQ